MLKMYLPTVPPVIGGNVMVPNSVWNELINYIESMRNCINTQADTIVELRSKQNTLENNIKTLAESLEGLYNESV